MSAFNLLELICLLLPIAALSGWYFGKKATLEDQQNQLNKLSPDYYTGLHFLLNEQPDKAVESFVRMLDGSPDSVETTLALGNFFRRRGEVDRAIHIHQNLMSKPDLPPLQREQALFELAQDFLRAGMYDRAELLLLELINNNGENTEVSLRHLVNIYEKEREWEKAIKMGIRLQKMTKTSLKLQIAHYFCELAEIAWSKGKIRRTYRYLKNSLSYDPNCVRASILEGDYDKKLANYKSALKAYQRVQFQDITFLPEVLLKIMDCYEKMGHLPATQQYWEHLLRQCPSISPALADFQQSLASKPEVIRYLKEYFIKNPSLQGLKYLMEYHFKKMTEELKSDLLIVKTFIEKLLEKRPFYKCGECGFSSKKLHWQCPSCREWSQVRPLLTLDSDSTSSS